MTVSGRLGEVANVRFRELQLENPGLAERLLSENGDDRIGHTAAVLLALVKLTISSDQT